MTQQTTAVPAPDLAALTGVRSGKRTYYSAYQRSNERLEAAVAAMDSISGALVHPLDGPRTFLEQVARVAADHLEADWVLLALAGDALPRVSQRFLLLDATGRVRDARNDLPPAADTAVTLVEQHCPAESVGTDAGTLQVPMMLEGRPVGAVIAQTHRSVAPEAADLSVLHILANLAAVSLHTADLYRTGLAEQTRAQQLFAEVDEQTRLLARRTDELREAEQRLRAADQRELLDRERRRIALELHDSVAQTVLTGGLVLEVLRDQISPDADLPAVVSEVDRARDLMGTATEQLRSVIYALHHERTAEDVASLPELLAEVADQHRPHLTVNLRVAGTPVPIGTAAEHALARTAGEALFNVAMHASATCAHVVLRYTDDAVVLRISDDGDGDPGAMLHLIRVARRCEADGRHRGLVGMAMRAENLGGTFSIRRAPCGGVRIESRIPIDPTATQHDRHQAGE